MTILFAEFYPISTAASIEILTSVIDENDNLFRYINTRQSGALHDF